MSLEFIRQKTGHVGLTEAVKQQKQLAYFTQSVIQEDVNVAYLDAWAQRNYSTNDYFLNYVKSVFRTDNFLSFFKYHRTPLPSAALVNNTIKTPLARVFYSEDSYFKYNINGEAQESVEELHSKKFDETLFNALLYDYNNIVVTGLKDINTPFRDIIEIENVIAIKSKDSVIHKIAYTAEFHVNESLEKGWLYMDANDYIFYYNEGVNNVVVPHDLGECPADYIARESFTTKVDVVRKSVFSYTRAEFEEYVFLKTLQRMTEPNGAIPIVTKLDTKSKGDTDNIKGSSPKEPMSSNLIGSQTAEFQKEAQGSKSLLQTGTEISVPIVKKSDGSIDMDVVSNFLNFFYIPVEALNYLKTRIIEIENHLIGSLLGDYSEANESAKNELQVGKSYVNKQDKLRSFSLDLSRIRNLSDFKFLALQHGKDNVKVDCFYGSDFFLDSEERLFNLFKDSPNTIERKDLLIKISRNKNRFNKDRMERQVLLYHLLPYCSDLDFDKAIERGLDDITFSYQTRFNYWIGVFESQFGDLLIFWESIEGENSEKLVLINNLIIQIITKEQPEVVPVEE